MKKTVASLKYETLIQLGAEINKTVRKAPTAKGKDEAAGKDAQVEGLVLRLRRGMKRRRYNCDVH
eukprot:evm.model.NODE_25358_length_19193_cov_56.069920.3